MAEEQRTDLRIGIDPSAAKSGAAEVKAALSGIKNEARGATSEAQRTEGAFARLRSASGLLRTALATAGLGSFALLLRQNAIGAKNFHDAMAEVSTLLSDTSGMDGLTASVRRLAVQFGADHQASAKALYQIISAGASDATQATNILTVANKLAVGGVTDVTSAADGLTSALNAFGSAAGTATDVSDAMFVAMRAGKTTIGELSSSIGMVAPLAAQAGASLEEMLAATAALTKGGMSTTFAVRGLRAILAEIVKPSSEAAKLAEKLGIEFNTAGLAARGFAGFMEHVAEKTKGNTDQMALLFGGVESLVPALSLTGKAAADFAATLDDMGRKAGETETAFNKMAESPGFKMRTALAAIRDEFYKLGDATLGVVVPSLDALAKNMDIARDAVVSLATAIGAFGLVKGMLAAKVAMEAAGGAAVFFAAKARLAWAAVTGPVGIAALGVGALATAIFGLKRHMDDSGDAAEKAAGKYKSLGFEALKAAQAELTADHARLSRAAETTKGSQSEYLSRKASEKFRELLMVNKALEDFHVGVVTLDPIIANAADSTADVAESTGDWVRMLTRGVELGVASQREVAKLRAEERRLWAAARDTNLTLEARVDAYERATAAAKARREEEERQIARAMRGRVQSFGMGRGTVSTGIQIDADEERRLLEDQIRRTRSAQQMKEIWDEAIRGVQRAFADGFMRIQTDGLKGFKEFAGSVLNVFQNLAAQIASAMLMGRLGIDKLLKDLQEKGPGALSSTQKMIGGGIVGIGVGMQAGQWAGNAGGGMMAGAAGGAAAGAMFGPMGAAIGGLTGAVSGFISGAGAAKEALRAFDEAMNNVAQSLRRFRDQALDLNDWQRREREIYDQTNAIFDQIRDAVKQRGGHISDIDIQSIDDLERVLRLFDVMGLGAGRTATALRDLRDALVENLEALERLKAARQQELQEDLNVRLLRAQGHEREADALALQHKQERELRAAREAGYDAATIALMERVQQEERIRAATEATTKAMRDATSALNSPSGLRLSLYRWRATMETAVPVTPTLSNSGSATGGGQAIRQVQVTLNSGAIQIAQRDDEDGEALAERLVEVLERRLLLGGGDVLDGRIVR